MADLWTAIAVMATLSLVVALLTTWLSPEKRQPQMLGITLMAVGMFTFIFYAAGHLIWATWIDDSAVIIWSNWTPVFAAAAAGICWRLEDTPRWRRFSMASALGLLSMASVMWPFLGMALRPQPPGGNEWRGPVAMQTSWATCSPAAAATFLNAGGMKVSETEMIPRCLTDAAGTPSLGLYRGVKVVAQENGRDVHASITSLDQLRKGNNFPAILLVELPETGVDDPRYEQQWGWIPGMGHTVVALGPASDGLVIGDPAVGREFWTFDDLEVLWHGESIQFVQEESNLIE